MTELDRVIERARGATVERGAAERYVRELERWARPAPRAWVPWLAAGLAAAAVVIVVALWPSGAPALVPVGIGDQVAIVAEPGTSYRVARADADATELAVERGAVTARLWRSDRPHRLALAGAGITATATGTIYRLAVGPGGPMVSVIVGSVEVRAADGVHVVPAGAAWPAAGRPDHAGARVLLALAAPPRVERPVVSEAGDAARAGGGADAGDVGDAAAADAGNADAVVDAGPGQAAPAPRPTPAGELGGSASASAPRSIKERWRVARLLRGQGRFADAVTECLEIADARDATWSPIALLEAIRIELGPLADPERAIVLADRMARDWPRDALAAEARELRCRALRQLGRGAGCSASP